MIEFLLGLGGGLIVVLVAWATKKQSSKPKAFPEAATPARDALKARVEADVEEVVALVETPKAESTLADILNEELK